MIIAVWGFTGAGKNTLGKRIAEKLNYRLVSPTFKDLAEKEGISLMELQRKAEKDHNIDKKFDELLKEEVAGGNCVVTTWLGPWMVDADVKIKIDVSEDERARRISGRDNMSLEEALEHVKERDENNKKRYYDVYGIDISDESVFDVVLDGRKTPDELLDISLKTIEKKRGK